ncbi:hypothetical protein Tco_0734509 [Tanacetum coccineum]
MRRVRKGFSRRDTPLFPTMMVQAQQEQGEADEAVNEEMDDSLVRAATTATGLNAEQDSGNINKTQSKATPNEPSFPGTSSGGGLRRQKTMRDTIVQTGKEGQELTSARVISSDEASLGDQEDASKQERKIDDIDKDAEITLVHETQGRYGDEEMFDTGVLDTLKSAKVLEKANVVEKPSESITKIPTLSITTTATTIIAVGTRSKAKGLVIHEEEQATTPTVSSQQPSHAKAQDKGKGIMIEEPVTMKKKDQISLDEELDFKQQVREEKKKRLPEKKLKEKKKLTLLYRIMYMGTELVEGNEVRAEGSETRVEGSSKREREELKQESSKKKILEEDNETAELQRLIEVVPDKEEVAIDAIALATKPPSIVDYKIHKEGKKNYYQIIRAMEVQRCT